MTVAAKPEVRDRRHDVLRALGFPEPIELGTLGSVAHLFGPRHSTFAHTPSRTSVYALLLPGERIYVGQAVDVVRRFAQHRRALGPIEALSFMPVLAADLDAREQAWIRAVEDADLRIANVMHVSDVQGERDLDLLVAPDLQERWLLDPLRVNAEERVQVPPVELPPVQRDRFETRFRRLEPPPGSCGRAPPLDVPGQRRAVPAHHGVLVLVGQLPSFHGWFSVAAACVRERWGDGVVRGGHDEGSGLDVGVRQCRSRCARRGTWWPASPPPPAPPRRD